MSENYQQERPHIVPPAQNAAQQGYVYYPQGYAAPQQASPQNVYAPTQPAVPYAPYHYGNGIPAYPTNPYYYNPALAQKEYEKRLKVEKAKQSLRYLGNMSGLSVLLFLAFNTIVSAFLVSPQLMQLYENNSVFSSAFSIVASFIYLFVPFSIVALLIRIKDKKLNFFPLKKLQPARALLCIPIGLTVCVGANIVTNYIITLFDSLGYHLSQQTDKMAKPQTAFALLVALVATAIMPALMEEYALRGVILQPARKYGMLFAIISSSAIFGLMHGNFVQAPFAFLVGMCFAFFVIKCDSLWIGVILHFINNAFSVIMSYVGERMPEASFNLMYYIIVSVVAIAGIICFVVLVLTDKQFFAPSQGNAAGEEAALLSPGQKFTAFFINVPMIISFLIMVLLSIQYVAKK